MAIRGFRTAGYCRCWISKYRVYIPDQRGHGDSDRPVGGYALTAVCGDVVAFMDAMNREAGRESWATRWEVSSRSTSRSEAPERVAELVLIGSATKDSQRTLSKDLQREINALKDPVPEKFVRDFQASMLLSSLSRRSFLRGDRERESQTAGAGVA